MLTIDSTKSPIVLIDGSYYIFYRYYATLRWFKFKNVEIDTSNLKSNESFLSAFKKHFYNDMNKLIKKWKVTYDNIYMCMDCERSNIWRNDIFNNYKGNRQNASDFNREIFDIFSKELNNIIREVRWNRLEADDVVALLKIKIRQTSTQQIIIITNDNDYIQLIDDNTIIMNMQMKEIITRCYNGYNNELFIKALLGDKSDNIPKAMKAINKIKAIEVSKMNDEERMKWIEEHNGLEQFNKNMELLSFDNIPQEISKNFFKNIKMI